MTDVDLSDWLTKQQAADAIGVSTKAIERWAEAKKLERRFRPQKGSPDVAVYHPDDVARIASERHPEAPPFVLPASPAGGGPTGNGRALKVAPEQESLLARNAGDDPIRQLFAAALRAVMSQTSQTSERIGGERLYLTLPEAAAWTGLTEAYLRRKCQDGSLKAIKDVAWKIRRTDLEAL